MKSLISPEKIVRGGQASPRAFYNFMTGGGKESSSTSASTAANNIVKFSSGAVKPNASSMSSLISNISSNVNNSNISSLVTKISTNVSRNESKNITNVISQNINKNFSNIVNKLTSQFKDAVSNTQQQVQRVSKNASSIVDSLKSQFKDLTNKTQKQVENTNRNFSSISSNLNEQFKKLAASKSQRQPESLDRTGSAIGNKLNEQARSIEVKTQKRVDVTLKSLIQNFKKDYQQKVQNKDASSPSTLLKNFLGLYKNAVDLISYFGDSKNNKRISNSLKNLRKIFTESFEVATVIRQSITKIVKQLSNLPTASGTAPDMNIDVKVPGGSLKQMGTRTINQVTKGQGMSAGAGMLGLGLLGAGAAAFGMSKAKEFQESRLYSGSKAKGVEKSQEVPDGFVDGLRNIISKLVDSIDKLVGMGQKAKPKSGSSSSSSAAAPPPLTTDQQGVSGSSAISMSEFSAEDVDVMGRMIAAEAGIDGKPEDQATVMNAMLNRYRSIKSGVARPEDYGVIGKTKENVTLKDILSVSSQWQPLRNNSFASMPSQSGQKALEGALSGGGNDPNKIYQLAISRGLSPEQAQNISNATFFYNPQISGNTPQPGAMETILPGGNRHAFQQPNNPRLRLVNRGSAYQASIGAPGVTTTTSTTQAQPAAPTLAPPPTSTQQSRPAPSQAAPQIINLPPQVVSAPQQPQVNVQNKVVPPVTTGSEGSAPDVSGLMDTTNPENPYIFLPFSLGIIM